MIEQPFSPEKAKQVFSNYPVFSLYLRYAFQDLECRWFADKENDPATWVLFAPPGVFFHGDVPVDQSEEIRRIVPGGAWIISPNPAWDSFLTKLYGADMDSFPRLQFDASHLSLSTLRSYRVDLPDDLKIEPIEARHLTEGMIKEEIADRYFAKRPFSTHGFGLALTNAKGVVHGFALTNYPVDEDRDVELSFRVGYESFQKYRGRGIATMLAAMFVEMAMERGFSPQWDAANETSQHIARKLGYQDHYRWSMHHVRQDVGRT